MKIKPEDELIVFGGDIKLTTTGLAMGDLVKFGEPDEADFDGDYFTKSTDFDLEPVEAPFEHDCDGVMRTVYATGKTSVYYNHGLDPVIGKNRLGGTKKADLYLTDTGVWIEAQLKVGARYDEMVKELMSKRKTGWSSGVPSHLAQKSKTGRARHVDKWSLGTDGSITVSPNDWRNVATLKTLAEELLQDPQAQGAAGQDVEGLVSDGKGDVLKQDSTLAMEITEMNETLKALIQEVVDSTIKNSNLALSEADIDAIAQKVAGLINLPEDKQDDPAEQIKAATDPAFITQIVELAVAASKTRTDAVESGVKNALATLKNKPVSKVDGVIQQDATKRTPVISDMRTQYHRLSPEDMAFMATYKQAKVMKESSGQSRWIPEEAFIRELAEKALKSENEDKLGLSEETADAIKAFKSNELDYTTQVGYGAEWIPEVWSSQMWNTRLIDSVVSPRFTFIDMPAETYKIPMEGDDPIVYVVAETKNDDQLVFGGSTHPIPPSKIPTANMELVARKMGVRVPFSMEFTEDSIVPVVSEVRRKTLRAMLRAIDYDILHADATNSSANITYNGASQVAGTKHLIGWDGLRHKALVDNTSNVVNFGGSAPTLAKIREMRGKLRDAYGMEMTDLVFFANYATYLRLQSIPEYLTLDKFGAQATITRGFLGQLDGIPLYVSDQYPLTDANGYISYDNANNLYGQLTLVYTPAVWGGYRRRVNVGMEYLASADAMQVFAHVRIALNVFDNDAIVVGRNIGVS